MAVYIIELNNLEDSCLATVSICNFSSNINKDFEERATYPTKRKACESIKYRFNDLDFETDTLIFNGTRVNSSLDLNKLIEKESVGEPFAVYES
ncbi:MAG TPA: hypothetical protein VHO72_11940 [Bacteroidales bacterium]|nr:hypothetical protein [Bacteroidales bacterium]